MATREEKLQLIKQLTTQIEIVADSIDEDAAEKSGGASGSGTDVPLSTLYLSDVMKKQKLKGKDGPAAGDDKELDEMIKNLNTELDDLKSQLKSKGKKRKK